MLSYFGDMNIKQSGCTTECQGRSHYFLLSFKNRRFINDMVKIYSITATNAVDGVASPCRACALGSEQSGSSCVPCPPGHYIEKETNQCMECPPDTYLSIHQVYGKEACIPCGPGSRSTLVSGSVFQLPPGKHILIDKLKGFS